MSMMMFSNVHVYAVTSNPDPIIMHACDLFGYYRMFDVYKCILLKLVHIRLKVVTYTNYQN